MTIESQTAQLAHFSDEDLDTDFAARELSAEQRSVIRIARGLLRREGWRPTRMLWFDTPTGGDFARFLELHSSDTQTCGNVSVLILDDQNRTMLQFLAGAEAQLQRSGDSWTFHGSAVVAVHPIDQKEKR